MMGAERDDPQSPEDIGEFHAECWHARAGGL
jgi:hypothetical protein